MPETKPMTMSDLGKRPVDHTAAAPAPPATIPPVAASVVADPKNPARKPAPKAGDEDETDLDHPEKAPPPSPSQAEADAIREGTFGRNRDAKAEAPAVGYKTR